MGIPVTRFTSSAFDHDTSTTIMDAGLPRLLRTLRFLRLNPLHWEANQTVQRTGASRHAEWRCGRARRLAPVADLCVRPLTHISAHRFFLPPTLALILFLMSSCGDSQKTKSPDAVTRLCQHIVKKRQRMIVDTNQAEIVWSDGAILEVGTTFPNGLQELISRPKRHHDIRSFLTKLDTKSPQWRDASVACSSHGDSFSIIQTPDGKISSTVESLYVEYLGQRYPTAIIRMRGKLEPIIFVVDGEVRASLMPVVAEHGSFGHYTQMLKELRDMPVADRPKWVPLFPWGTPYFRAWCTVRWFLVMLAPIAVSTFQLWSHHHGAGVAMFHGFIGAWVSVSLFVTLASGMASSNRGTHFRQTEAAQYWMQTSFIGVVYLVVACLGHFV